jgi:REP element-mobilizing transposase RayT
VIYLITFAYYGCHLHGSESGSVDPVHNVPGTPILEADSERAAFEGGRMDQSPYHLDQIRRDAVLKGIQEVCVHRGWSLLVAHVRSNHVHTVVEAEVPPERVMSDFKAYASRHLNRMRLDGTESEAMGTPWQHTMAVETTACLGGHPVRRR